MGFIGLGLVSFRLASWLAFLLLPSLGLRKSYMIACVLKFDFYAARTNVNGHAAAPRRDREKGLLHPLDWLLDAEQLTSEERVHYPVGWAEVNAHLLLVLKEPDTLRHTQLQSILSGEDGISAMQALDRH